MFAKMKAERKRIEDERIALINRLAKEHVATYGEYGGGPNFDKVGELIPMKLGDFLVYLDFYHKAYDKASAELAATLTQEQRRKLDERAAYWKMSREGREAYDLRQEVKALQTRVATLEGANVNV